MSYHETLGVAENATREEITVAYRKLAMAQHPDRPGAEPGRFEQITRAREALLAQLDKVGLFDDIFRDIAKEIRR